MKTDFQPNEVLTAEALNTNFQECEDKANINHTHAISTITGLQSALDEKASADDLHSLDNIVQGLDDSKADVVHTHSISDITDLQTILNNFSYRIASLEGRLCVITFINSSEREVEADSTNLPIYCSVNASHLSFDTETAKFTLKGSSIVNNTAQSKTIKITHKVEHLEADPGISNETTYTTTIVVPENTTLSDIELTDTMWREFASAYPDKTPTSFSITNIVSE